MTFRTVDLIQYERFRPSSISGLRLLNVSGTRSQLVEKSLRLVTNRHETVENAQGTCTTDNGTVNGCKAERIGTFEPEHSNDLERIVENVCVHDS